MAFKITPDNRSCIHNTLGFMETTHCPYCGAPNIREIRRRWRDRILFILLIAIVVAGYCALFIRT